MTTRWYHSIRYEYQRWPLWRLDLDLAYILKSLDHKYHPSTLIDKNHFLAMHQWLKQHQWPTVSDEQAITLCAMGDMMWIRSGWLNALSAGVKQHLAHADLTLTNLETPIDPARKVPKWVYETFHYNAPKDYLTSWNVLPSHIQHVFSICNNHALDQKEEGLQATRNSILEQGTHFHCLGGVNQNEDAMLLTIKGIKIGFMASTFAINHLKTNQPPPKGVPIHLFGCPHREPDWVKIAEHIQKMKAQGAEFIIFSPHWGYEYEYWPDALQRTHALKLIELGVDLILGHSPHVVQPVEMVSINKMDVQCPLQVERPGAKGFGVIAWSLGNFLTIMPTLPCKTGVIFKLELVKKEQQILIKKIELTPVYTTKSVEAYWLDRQVVCLHELSGPQKALKTRIIRHCQHISPLMNLGDPQ